MQCPVDSATLVMADRQGVEIDYCPQCRGVWLDRGELDKLIERSARLETAGGGDRDRDRDRDRDYDDRPRVQRRDDDDDWRRSQQPYGNRKKKKSFLSEVFDFD